MKECKVYKAKLLLNGKKHYTQWFLSFNSLNSVKNTRDLIKSFNRNYGDLVKEFKILKVERVKDEKKKKTKKVKKTYI